jgi:hypothetical protein
MPKRLAASLRRDHPCGFSRQCSIETVSLRVRGERALVILLTGTILAATSTTSAADFDQSSKSRGQHHRARHRAVNPKSLWSRFPLAPRRASSGQANQSRPRPSRVPQPKERVQRQQHSSHSLRDATIFAILLASIVVLVFSTSRRLRRRRAGSQGDVRRSGRLAASGESTSAPLQSQIETTARPEISRRPKREATAHNQPEAQWHRPGHLLFVPTDKGYTLLERPGDAPPVLRDLDGAELGLEGRFRVLKIVASPLPSDERPCAYLERT